MGHAQHQKQDDEGEQDADDDVHLVDGEGKFVVEFLFGVDEVGVVVVQQGLFAGLALGFGGFKLCLLLFQLCLPLRQQCFAAGQLFLPAGLIDFGHDSFPPVRFFLL